MPISDGLISARQLCSNAVDTRTIAPGAVTPTEVLTGFNFVELVTVLPTTGNFEGRMVYLTTDDKLYRHDGSAFLLAVDGADITAATISGDKMIANTITAGEIQAGAIGASELAAVNIEVGKFIRSTTYTPGSAGWSIDADGAAEFENLIARGTIESDIYTPGSAGWQINEDGSAEFDNVTARGDIEADTGKLTTLDVDGTLTMITNGKFRTAVSGARLEIQNAGGTTSRIRFFNAAESESFIQEGGLDDISIVANGLAQMHVRGTIGDPHIRFGTDTRLRAGPGTATKPTFSFGLDDNTGMFNLAANQLAFSAAGSTRVRIGASFLVVSQGALNDNDPRLDAQGTATNPAYTFRGDTDTGAYRVGVNQYGISVGGTARLTLDTVQIRATGSAHFVDSAPGTTGTIDAQWEDVGGSVRQLSEPTSMLSKKQDVTPLEEFLDTSKVLDLDLIAFHMKEDPDGPMHIGTVAASVGKHLPALAYKRDGKWDFGSYSRLVIPLIAEVRKLRDRVEILEAA